MVDMRCQHAETLVSQILVNAQGAKSAPRIALLLRGEHAIASVTDAAVELDRTGDIRGARTVVGRATDTARIDQLRIVVEQAEVEDALIFGEERALIRQKGFF